MDAARERGAARATFAGEGVRHPHVPELQSIRGIASMCVMLAHAAFIFDTSPGFRYASEVLLNAHAALVTFFVLSGFVLSRSMSGSHFGAGSLLRFYVRRVFRIYPVFAVASALGWAFVLLLNARFPTPHASAWYDGVGWAEVHPTWHGLLKTAVVWGTGLVPPLWTIHFELVASFLLPLLWWLTRWKPASAALLVVSCGLVRWSHPQGEVVLSFMFSFIVGVVAMRYVGFFSRRPLPGWGAWAAFAVLVGFRRISHGWDFERDYLAFAPTVAESLAAAVIVLWAAQRPRGGGLLRLGIVVWLGDISYSVYALHQTILFSLSKLPFFAGLSPDADALVIMALTAAITLPLSAFSYARLEKPGIALGDRLLERLGLKRQ